MPDPLGDRNNYDALLKALAKNGPKKRYKWDDVENTRRYLNHRLLTAPDSTLGKIEGSLAIVKLAKDEGRQNELLDALVRFAKAEGNGSSGTSRSARSAGGGSAAKGSVAFPLQRRHVIAAMGVAAFGLVALWPDPGGGPSGVSRPASRGGQAASTSSQQTSPRQEEDALGLGGGTWRNVQAGLAAEGFSPGGWDGVPGSATRDAVREWQRSRGLPESGYLNAAQVATLEAVGVAELARREAANRAAAARAREDSVARGRAREEAARAAATQAREDSVLFRIAVRPAAAATQAREDSIARAREREEFVARLRAQEVARRAAVERAREDSIARARAREEAARAAEARAREDAGAERRILSGFRELELELASSYAELTRRYLGQWRAVNWDRERPSVERRGSRSVDDDFGRSNWDTRERLRQSGDRLRRERSPTPRIETAHREFQQNVDQHHNRLLLLIGNVPGKVSALFIDVNPSDATVYINDASYGAARGFANEPGRLIPSGTVKIRVEREGYATHEETVRMRPYERHFIRGNMIRNQ